LRMLVFKRLLGLDGVGDQSSFYTKHFDLKLHRLMAVYEYQNERYLDPQMTSLFGAVATARREWCPMPPRPLLSDLRMRLDYLDFYVAFQVPEASRLVQQVRDIGAFCDNYNMRQEHFKLRASRCPFGGCTQEILRFFAFV
jgi:hypothetical protein